MKLWGVSVSYFTGKIEAYLRYKRLPYDMEPPFADSERIKAEAGAIQVPIIERDDGRFMSDSSPIILALEEEFPARPVLPNDPVVRFIALLIEDYADEWLWRAAMHYRWSYEHGRELISRVLADEIMTHLWWPRWFKRNLMKFRQRVGYVVNDGVTKQTWDHVEQGFFTAMKNMTTMLENRPFLLGDVPSVADIGLMGPMMRHFGQDPDPQAIMRDMAPQIFEWQARVWNSGALECAPAFVTEVPEDAKPMLQEIAETHMVQLRENALAYASGAKLYEMNVQGTHYVKLPVSQYRVYCIERLRDAFDALDAATQAAIKAQLPQKEFDLIWQRDVPAQSGYDVDRIAPYNKAINVFAYDVKSARFG